jgi:hypothetical protein
MYYCSCEVDIFLSQLPVPEDLKAHCEEVVKKNLEFLKLPEKEQMTALMETGAEDINVNSLLIFSFVAPCLIKALKSDDNEKMDRVEKCLCLAHEFAKEIYSIRFSSNYEVVGAMTRFTKDIISSNNCNE